MEYKTNPWLIVVTIVVTAIVAGGGVYLWQSKNPTEVIPKTTIQPENITEESPSPLVQSIQGTIKYGPDFRTNGDIFLTDKENRTFSLRIQEPTKLIGISEMLYDEGMKKILKETGETYPWFGLISDITVYIKDGQTINVRGLIDFIDPKILAYEIQIK